MGSKKRDVSSSSSSSDSDSSEKHSKSKKMPEKSRKRSNSDSEEDNKKHKSKRQEDSSPEARRRSKHQDDSDNEDKSRKRRRSPSEEHKGRSSNQRGRHDRDHRSDDRDRRSHDRDRRQDDRDRKQDDRDRKPDDRDHRSGDRHRAPRHDERDRDRRGDRRDDRDRRDDGRNYRDRNSRGGGGFRRGNRDRDDNFDHANAKWGKDSENKGGDKKAPGDKQKPNFGLSGKLTEETNTYKGVVIKYSEPPEARKPKRRWRLYPFKGEKALQTLYIHRESAYLIGRDRKVVDLPVDHPSCSKQHAALQYRLVPFMRDDGSTGKRVRPYLIDLESSNGTFINNKQIESKKYVELLERDVIKFGFSSREYVLLHENSKDEAQDDDVKNEEELLPVKKEEPAE